MIPQAYPLWLAAVSTEGEPQIYAGHPTPIVGWHEIFEKTFSAYGAPRLIAITPDLPWDPDGEGEPGFSIVIDGTEEGARAKAQAAIDEMKRTRATRSETLKAAQT